MKVTVSENQAMDNIEVTGTSVWDVGPKVNQILSVEVEAESSPGEQNEEDPEAEPTAPSADSEQGHLVGLVQNLTKSSRVATYENGGTLTITPAVGIPCVDGDPDTKPWYNKACKGQALPPPGQSITLTLDDAPDVQLPKYATHAPGPETSEQVSLENLVVDEEFTISLYDETAKEVIRQWAWSYHYEVQNQDGRAVAMGILNFQAIEVAEGEINQDIKLDGNVPQDGQEKAWSEGMYSEDFM